MAGDEIRWTSLELSNLTNAIEKHGTGDVTLLVRAVRTKTQVQVEILLAELRKSAHGSADEDAQCSWYHACKRIDEHGIGFAVDTSLSPENQIAAANEWDVTRKKFEQIDEIVREEMHKAFVQHAAQARKTGAKNKVKSESDDTEHIASVYEWLAEALITANPSDLPLLSDRAKMYLKSALDSLDQDGSYPEVLLTGLQNDS